MNKDFETIIIFGDTHGKKVDKKAFNCFLKVLADINPDRVIHDGDVGDFESVSAWLNKKKLRKEGLRIGDDIADAQRILSRVTAIVKRTCIKEVILGNHDGWVSEYIELNPELAGEFDLLKLYSKGGWKVYPENSKLQVGKLTVFHNIPKIGGEFHTKKTVIRMGTSCLYGHYHDHQKYSLIQFRGKHSAQSIGCLCDLDMDYMEGSPTRWTHGFAVVYMHKKTGYFTTYFVEITKGNTVWNGKFYSG